VEKMAYFLGVDGGATKTLAVVGDATGRILGTGRAGPSNHQIVGLDVAMFSVGAAIRKALAEAGVAAPAPGLAPGAVAERAVFGLAGADFPVDFERLSGAEGCAQLMGGQPFRVVNDCWIALRGGTKRGYGVVAINGTGANTAGRNSRGEQKILRGMGYEFGNRGGGADVIKEALHWAFRAEEGTGPATSLVDEVPKAVGLASMAAVAEAMYGGQASPAMAMPIVPLVFRLANAGDRVCQDILVRLGDAMGAAAGGVARGLGMGDEEFDVVLAGSVWLGESPLMRDQFTLALHREAPRAHPVMPLFSPAVGAYLMALEDARGEAAVTEEVYANLAATAGEALSGAAAAADV